MTTINDITTRVKAIKKVRRQMKEGGEGSGRYPKGSGEGQKRDWAKIYADAKKNPFRILPPTSSTYTPPVYGTNFSKVKKQARANVKAVNRLKARGQLRFSPDLFKRKSVVEGGPGSGRYPVGTSQGMKGIKNRSAAFLMKRNNRISKSLQDYRRKRLIVMLTKNEGDLGSGRYPKGSGNSDAFTKVANRLSKKAFRDVAKEKGGWSRA